MIERRQFSGGMKGKNLRYLNENPDQPVQLSRTGFLLLEHFSLPAFTQALDTIVTANLLRPKLFSSRTFGLSDGEVVSDLGLVIRPDARIDAAAIHDLDLLVICGGYRTELKASEELINLLRQAADQGISLAGLWNGGWFLGVAGLLDGYRCAIHPEHRPALAEIAKATHVTSEPYVIDRDRLTASSPSGAFHMALDWIKGLYDKALVEGIEDILAFEESRYRRIKPSENICVQRATARSGEVDGRQPRGTAGTGATGGLCRTLPASTGAIVQGTVGHHTAALLHGTADHRSAAIAAAHGTVPGGCAGGVRFCIAEPFQQVLQLVLWLPAVQGKTYGQMKSFRVGSHS